MPAQFIAGVDLGATNVRVVIANEDGEIEARRAGPLPPGTPEEIIGKIGRTIDELVRGVWIGNKVAAIGIVLPGLVDPSAGLVQSVANLPGWDHVPIAELLGGPRGVPVAMENDANAAAIGEGWRGASKGAKHHVFIALGSGIGSGVVIDGKLHRGAHFLAGEIAFFRLTTEHLHDATLEQSLEGVVGGMAVRRRAVELLGPDARAADLFDAAWAGDPRAEAWLEEAQEYLAMAVCGVVSLLDPEIIVFGGGVIAAQGERFLAPVRELVHRAAPVRTPIVVSELGEDAQIVGGIRLALDVVG